MNDVEKRLASLANVAQELNRTSDEVTSFLRDVENRLAGMKLGVEVWGPPFYLDDVDLVGDDVSGVQAYTGTQYLLGYAKIGASWRLAAMPFQSLWAGEDEGCVSLDGDLGEERGELGDPIPLLDMSREIRLEATSNLGWLLARIEEAALERVRSIRAAISTARESTEGTGAKGACKGQVSDAGSEPLATSRRKSKPASSRG